MSTNKAWLCLLTLHGLTLGNKFGVPGLDVLSFGIVDFSIDGISIFFVLWTSKDAASERSTAKASTACNCQGSISGVLQSNPAAPIGCFALGSKKGQRGWKKDKWVSRKISSFYCRWPDSRTWRVRASGRSRSCNGDGDGGGFFFITHLSRFVFDLGW